MFLIKRNVDIKSAKILIRLYSFGRKNHYDILNLRRNCTDKDIKEAFIKLSKEYHPDKNKDARAQEKFVDIVEAYNVLSKPSSRARYDNMTEIHGNDVYRPPTPYNMRSHAEFYSYYYASQSKSTGSTSQGPTKQRVARTKLPNYVIIAFCTGVALVGALIQMFVIRRMYFSQRQTAQEKTKLLAEELDRVRAGALNGNEAQTRLLLEKIVSAANPTVATASLGTSLATDKK